MSGRKGSDWKELVTLWRYGTVGRERSAPLDDATPRERGVAL